MRKIDQIMDRPFVYRLFQRSMQKEVSEQTIINDIIKPAEARNVLDFGCGVGHHSQLFSTAMYLGIEPLSSCVKRAETLYATETTRFEVGNENLLKSLASDSFDLIIAIGVLHHIADGSAQTFFSEAARLLAPGGRLVTLDPFLFSGQRRISKIVILQDRGKNVRTEAEYLSLSAGKFARVSVQKYSNLIRLPYDHVAFTMYKE